jgi:hypothetical protein
MAPTLLNIQSKVKELFPGQTKYSPELNTNNISVLSPKRQNPGNRVAQSNLPKLNLERGAVEVAGAVAKAYCFDSGLFCSTPW